MNQDGADRIQDAADQLQNAAERNQDAAERIAVREAQAAIRVQNLTRVRGGRACAVDQSDTLAEETPIALEYNGISVATMLASPTDIEDFALGFSLTEGLVGTTADIRGIDVARRPDGIVVSIEISSACAARLKARRRAMAGRTGCGLCGVETLGEVLRPIEPVPSGPPMPLATLLAAMQSMRTAQTLHTLTGATHAAAWSAADGTVLLVREDVGRHNALDKLLGAMARRESDRTERAGAVLVSSRASYEMVQKTALRGIGILAAVSAPTSLARQIAQDVNMALVGFVRQTDCTIYSHPERIAT